MPETLTHPTHKVNFEYDDRDNGPIEVRHTSAETAGTVPEINENGEPFQVSQQLQREMGDAAVTKLENASDLTLSPEDLDAIDLNKDKAT